MVLKDLIRIAYNAGFNDVDGFDAWWDSEGEERYEEYMESGEVQRDIDRHDGRLSDATPDS